MKKIKRFIHKIKRHKRNKMLSKFADNIFYAISNSCWNYNIFVHPLIYEIIRFRYIGNDALVKMYSCIRAENLVSDYTSIIIR